MIRRILCQWKIQWHQLGSSQRRSHLQHSTLTTVLPRSPYLQVRAEKQTVLHAMSSLWLCGLKNNWNVLETFNKAHQSPSAVLELSQADRTDEDYMTSVFLQHFPVTRHITSAVFSVLWDLRNVNMKSVVWYYSQTAKSQIWQTFRYKTNAGFDTDTHSSAYTQVLYGVLVSW